MIVVSFMGYAFKICKLFGFYSEILFENSD